MLCTYKRESRQKTAVLENAFDIVESEVLNNVSELSFSMPIGDVKADYCIPFDYVRWNDTGQFYRILDGVEEIGERESVIKYNAEHVIATLIDDVIFGSLQLDNLPTKTVIEKILSLQSVKNWTIGDCDITRYFSYNWSNENLLVALFSVPDRFDEEYKWIFDTSVYPWKIHLKRLDQSINPEFYVRSGRNLLGANKTSNGREICTRLYALGYGEGINQLTFASVNGDKPYIDADSATIGKYGLISRIWEDLRFEDPQALLDRAKVLLKGYSKPYESYQLQIADLEKLTKEKYDTAEAGKIVWFDSYKTYITRVTRYLLDVGRDEIDIANAPVDVASSIADLADRQRINSVYAQGATCLYSQQFNDNADPGHPAVLRFYVPSEARQINKVVLTWEFERFRAYNVGAESTTDTVKSTSSGGGSSQTSSSGGGSSTTSGASSELTTGQNPTFVYDRDTSGMRGSPDDHYHVIYNFEDVGQHRHAMEHTHNISISRHSHEVDIPSHAHSFDVPGHTHSTIYGIYEGPRANTAIVKVDGKEVALNGATEIDVAANLSVDSGGKIRRGTFHTIEIIPNNLTRISAAISVQLFIQSEGGGLY